jgi:exopolysaccharide biosynthesis polyprenyl glycosylphosphotransferase
MFSHDTAALAAKLRVPEIVVCTMGSDRSLPGAADFIRKSGISVVDFESFYERETGKVDLTNLPKVWPFTPALRAGFAPRAAKRAFDVAASLLAIAATAPVMALTALAIRIEDGKPSLFRQTRVGLNGREFTLYKFRSMRIDAESGCNPVWASENDTRITRVGSVIRKFRIDELPQFYNTLRGEMSFIGPRPERPYFVQQLEDQIPCYAARHTVKPGITGWAQVSYHYGASFEDAFEKTAYDLYYVKHQSVLLDISIVLRTVKVILWPRGVR